MIDRQEWEEFRKSGLLWWVNRTLHLFGWAIIFSYDDNEPTKLLEVYPAKVDFRGFFAQGEEEGFARLTHHIKENVDEWINDVEDPPQD